LAETAVVVLPAAAAGQALAWLLLPEARAWPSLAASAAGAALACLALPVRAALAHRTPRVHEARPAPGPAPPDPPPPPRRAGP
ncbi:hypothetical protein AB8B12_34120, partial [Streptomyces sp. PGLac3x]